MSIENGPQFNPEELSEKDKKMMGQPEEKPALDEKWYPRLQEFGSFDSFIYYRGDETYRSQQKEKFLSGEIENPSFDYPLITDEELNKKEEGLLELKKDVLEQEKEEALKQTYRWKLNEKIAEIRMLRASKNNDMRKFQKYSEFIYGKPQPEIFAYTINNINKKIEKFLDSPDENIKKAALDLQALLPQNLGERKISSLPDQEIINKAQSATLKEAGALIGMKAPEEGDQIFLDLPFNNTEITNAFQNALNNLKADDWKIIQGEKSQSFSVNQEKKEVTVPKERQLLLSKLQALIVHEIGTHVARRLNGERSRIKILGLGLDRYDTGEEGAATTREQALEGKVEDFRGLDGHFAISLASGLDGKKRNFKQVYEILEKYYLFENLTSGKTYEDAVKSARNTAYDRSFRTFRGTDCKTPGACFTKDIVYREGNIGTWNAIKENEGVLIQLSIGKWDPANARHLWILEQLVISEKNLNELEK